MRVLSDVITGLRWNASLGAKFLRVVPYSTLAIVLLTLVSQIAMLAASFLPLKVIIMLGSEGIPSYFPGFLAVLDRDVLIGLLSVGTVGFFLVHLACERVIEISTSYATSKLLAKSQKMVLFEKQEDLAASSYQRYSRALAGGVFVVMSLIGLGWVYPEMPMVMAGYFLFVMLLLWQGGEHSASMQDRLENKLAQLMNVSAMAGFFVAFGYLVIDFIFFIPPGVIVALISFLLIRQVMQRAANMTVDLTLLYRQKPKLNALFFHGQVFQPLQADPKRTLWPLLKPETRLGWVADVLSAVAGDDPSELTVCWHQLGNPSVVGLRATRGERLFLLKLYEPIRSSLALHEVDLMAECPENLPCLQWLGIVPVDKFHCLVYQLKAGEAPELAQVGSLAQDLRTALLATTLRHDVVQRYTRSKAMLWQRLDQEMLVRLQLAINGGDAGHSLSVLLSKLTILQDFLAALPLAVCNVEMYQEGLWVPVVEDNPKKEPVMLNWGGWSLEPIGAGWPESELHLNRLNSALEIAAVKRSALTSIRVEQVELAALAFALERECTRQRYNQALELIPRILERMYRLESLSSSRNVNAE